MQALLDADLGMIGLVLALLATHPTAVQRIGQAEAFRADGA
jgi:hypothetical protein